MNNDNIIIYICEQVSLHILYTIKYNNEIKIPNAQILMNKIDTPLIMKIKTIIVFDSIVVIKYCYKV